MFQIDLGANPSVSASQAYNISFAAKFAAGALSENMATLGSEYPNLMGAQLLQATAAFYNLGVGEISGNPGTIDVGSTGGNYGGNVVSLMNCFQNP